VKKRILIFTLILVSVVLGSLVDISYTQARTSKGGRTTSRTLSTSTAKLTTTVTVTVTETITTTVTETITTTSAITNAAVARVPAHFGDGEDYLLFPLMNPAGADYIQAWNNLMPRLKKWGINLIRLSAAFQDMRSSADYGPSGISVLDYTKLENIVKLLDANGIKVIFDFCHVTTPDYFGSEAWMNNWVEVATRYKNDPRVFAFELYNEPFPETWTPAIRAATTYPSPYTDVQRALATCTDRIRATGDNHTIIWPDHDSYHNWNYVYYDTANIRPNIIQTWHFWLGQWGIDTYGGGTSGLGWWNVLRGNIEKFMRGYPNIPVQVGEIGGYTTSGGPESLPGGPAVQKEFIDSVINWCVAKNVDCIWWLVSTDHWVTEFADEVLAASNYKPP